MHFATTSSVSKNFSSPRFSGIHVLSGSALAQFNFLYHQARVNSSMETWNEYDSFREQKTGETSGGVFQVVRYNNGANALLVTKEDHEAFYKNECTKPLPKVYGLELDEYLMTWMAQRKAAGSKINFVS